jgi:hypothetical protein
MGLVLALTAVASALPPFGTTRTISGNYLLGTSSLAEFDFYETRYPGNSSPYSITFYPNGTCSVQDSQSSDVMTGTYTRPNNNRIVVTVPLNNGYVSTMQFKLYKLNNSWWGEIYWDASLSGHLRGTF